jgi:tetratricopeptide (TPR) repeat protein
LSPAVRALALAGVAVLAGLAVGRFLTARAGPEVAEVPAAVSLVETIAILEDQVSVEPGDAGARQRLGIAYLQRAAEVGDPTLYAAAERVLGEAKKLAPGDARTVTALGVLALALHAFDEALRLGLAAHADESFSADPLAVVVDAEVELGDYRSAANHLQQMLDLRPGLAALSRTSYLRELHGDLEGAIEAMEQARLAGSGSVFDVALVTALSGNLMLSKGDVVGAESAFAEAAQLAPDLSLAEVGRARVELARGNLDAATEGLADSVERFPAPEAVILLAETLAVQGRQAEADTQLELVRTITRLQQDSGQVVDLEMARFEADHGDPVRALSLAREVYRIRPTIHAADVLGWAIFRSGRPRAALPRTEESLRLGSLDPVLRYHAAAVFFANGREERAADELEVALTHRFALSPTQLEEALTLATEVGVAVPGMEG